MSSLYVLAATALWLVPQTAGTAQANSGSGQTAAPHDGQHDFDFEIGKWKAHLRYLRHRLSGSDDWEDFDGTVVTTPFMGGKGNSLR